VTTQLEVEESGLRVGAAVPLTLINEQLKQLIASRPSSETSTFRAIVEQLRWFAGVQVRPHPRIQSDSQTFQLHMTGHHTQSDLWLVCLRCASCDALPVDAVPYHTKSPAEHAQYQCPFSFYFCLFGAIGLFTYVGIVQYLVKCFLPCFHKTCVTLFRTVFVCTAPPLLIDQGVEQNIQADNQRSLTWSALEDLIARCLTALSDSTV
jgi:hypothetical protein